MILPLFSSRGEAANTLVVCVILLSCGNALSSNFEGLCSFSVLNPTLHSRERSEEEFLAISSLSVFVILGNSPVFLNLCGPFVVWIPEEDVRIGLIRIKYLSLQFPRLQNRLHLFLVLAQLYKFVYSIGLSDFGERCHNV